jgi:hypothetical protein
VAYLQPSGSLDYLNFWNYLFLKRAEYFLINQVNNANKFAAF